MKPRVAAIALLLLFATGLGAQPKGDGIVTGTVLDKAANHPTEFAVVTLKTKTGNATVESTITDSRGRFTLENVPAGDYRVVYGLVGLDTSETHAFTLDAQHKAVDLGELDIATAVVTMEKVEVKARQTAFLNSIDRKVYNVGKEIQSTSGSASDLLQNIPSVQVDIDGNVSLRGSENVMILVNGRTSTLMGASRAEVLQQLPADSIEKIEVITNPSAKYKPDGTAGIINIALKKKHDAGFSTVVNVSAGNDNRYQAGVSSNYNPGKYNLFASYSVRQDDRLRHATDVRTFTDPVTGVVTQTDKTTDEQMRPFSRIARGGADYNVGDHDKVGVTGNYNNRTMLRRATDYNLSRDIHNVVTADYDRTRYDPEYERGLEFSTTYQHTFAKEDHELNLEFKSSSSKEQEDNHYADIFRTPVQAPTYDNTLIKNSDRGTEAIVEYVYPIDDDSRFEAGYTRTGERFDADFYGESLNPATGLFVRDPTVSNRFRHDNTIHAFYVTYARTIGKFGLLAGLRPELAYVNSRLVDTGTFIPNDYSRVYPSLHLTYDLTDKHQVQLNYSHRVRRPETDDLNPFPEYSDPYNLRAGNPRLLPEDIHSVEAGYSFKNDDTSFTSTVYHRYLYHGFTNITRYLGNSVFLTTHENLAVSRSTGLELTANADLGKLVSLNFSSNTFFNTIDASNLGYSSSKSDISWMAKLGATFHLPKDTLMQFNTNYTSSRLTPQGSRRPSFVANIGLRHEVFQNKAALVLTVSDLFNSLKETTLLDTPGLREETIRRRSSRIVYLGFIYNFGKPPKKSKDDPLKFDNSL